MNIQDIKLIERQVKSVLTIGDKNEKGFTYTRELIEEILRLQQPLIDQRKLFVTIGYDKENVTDLNLNIIEGIVTNAEISEDNKVSYNIMFLEKISNLYLSMHIPMSVEIPVKGKIVDGTIKELEIMNYVDMVFDNPKETLEKMIKAVNSIKELVTTIEVKDETK